MAEQKRLNKEGKDKEKQHCYEKPQLIKYPKVKRIFGAVSGVELSS